VAGVQDQHDLPGRHPVVRPRRVGEQEHAAAVGLVIEQVQPCLPLGGETHAQRFTLAVNPVVVVDRDVRQ
jgi:hypothetical protein